MKAMSIKPKGPCSKPFMSSAVLQTFIGAFFIHKHQYIVYHSVSNLVELFIYFGSSIFNNPTSTKDFVCIFVVTKMALELKRLIIEMLIICSFQNILKMYEKV